MKKLTLIAFSVLAACIPADAEDLQLSFSRLGTDANSVTVSATGIDGVTAKVTSVSHSLKPLTDNSIICPDVNGNTNPEITISLAIEGVPTTQQFNRIGLDIHALNAGGAYQSPGDGKARQWNVMADINNALFVEYDDIDIASGVTEGHKTWTADAAEVINASNPMTLTISVTAGTSNLGCFFGLGGITLSYNNSETPDPTPDPVIPDNPDNPDGNVYTISWKNTRNYMCAMEDGSVQITGYVVSSAIFWQLVPTDKENCYYVRNTANGKYIGSCNMTPNASSRIQMSDTPVEYFIGTSASTEGDNVGCKWFSSTDCDNYNDETKGPRALNKDGASAYVITWTAGISNKGSYWTLTESEDLYEVRPFTPSPAIGQATVLYHIIASDTNLSYTADGQWADVAENSAQRWYFVGSGNKDGGYQIVNGETAINDGAGYTVARHGSAYSFIGAAGDTLVLNGKRDFTFTPARSLFALNNQIYKMPCGTLGTVHINKATIGEDYHYPMGKKSGKKILYPNGEAQKYVILSRDAATVTRGSDIEMTVTLNASPGRHTLLLFVDWDKDGLFEHSQEVVLSGKEGACTISVPADAAIGKTRARLRLNSNGLNGADDDVAGQIVDLLLNVCEAAEELFAPTVSVNDPARGIAEWADGVAKATGRGTSLLLYWRDGNHRIVSLDSEYACPAAPVRRKLTAVFSANFGGSELNGIENLTADRNALISFDGSVIKVVGSEARSIMLFAVNGTLAARGGSSLGVAGVAPGIYIVKAITANGIVSSKLKI